MRRRVSDEGGWANEAARLVWLLGPAGFPEGSREKSSSSHIGKSTRPANRTLACPAPDRRLVGAVDASLARQAW